MAKSAVKYHTAWGWQDSKGKLVADAFASKIDAQESFYSTEENKLVRVQIVPYKKRK